VLSRFRDPEARTRNVIQWPRPVVAAAAVPAAAVPAPAVPAPAVARAGPVPAAAVPAASIPRRSFSKSASLTPAVDTLTHGAKLLNLRDSRAIATP